MEAVSGAPRKRFRDLPGGILSVRQSGEQRQSLAEKIDGLINAASADELPRVYQVLLALLEP
jgi:hypothetical protein